MSARNDKGLEYSLTYQDVTEILRILKETEFCDSFNLEIDGMKINFTRASPNATAAQPVPAAAATLAPAVMSAPSAPSTTPVPATSRAEAEGCVIRAPSVGVFYCAPEPDAQPFVKVGDVVQPGDQIGLLEVMKLFSPVTADAAGTVMETLVDNAELVEYGQPLLRLEPLAEAAS